MLRCVVYVPPGSESPQAGDCDPQRRRVRLRKRREVRAMLDHENGRTVGLETEVMLIDNHGDISNRATQVVNHRHNTGNIVAEFSHAVVEANPPPSSSIAEVEANLLTELRAVSSIAESLGLAEVPLSELGPGNRSERVLDVPRYALFEEVMGKEHCDMERSSCGTHLHVDHEENLVGEYNLLQSMDPVFALMSSSSFMRGRNTVNCSRVNLYRNNSYTAAPYMCQLSEYVSGTEEIDSLQAARSRYFLDRLEPTVENERIFGGYNNGSSPIRKTNKTIEIRCADSNIPTLALAMAALYKGVLHRVFGSPDLEIKIAPPGTLWSITSSEIFLPSCSTLRMMESEAVALGPSSETVNEYLSHLVTIAERGLPSDETKYLRPFREILRNKRNVAHVIAEKARLMDPTTSHSISSVCAARVNTFVAEQYKDDLAGGSQLIDMISYGVE